MYLLLYYRNGLLFDLPGSEERLLEFISKEPIDPVCICQDWDYQITDTFVPFSPEEAKKLLYHHLNEKING